LTAALDGKIVLREAIDDDPEQPIGKRNERRGSRSGAR
jgi:hypothetical protein